MRKYVLLIVMAMGLIAATMAVGSIAASYSQKKTKPDAVGTKQSAVVFDSEGRMKAPDPAFRRWVFVGAPLTPHGLNNGKAGFPEYHHVYIEEKNVDAYLKTGSFPEGTVIVKELTRVLDPTFPDGSRKEPSGRGFFNGEFNGIDLSIKDSKKYAKTNGWGYFTFGHHPEPYEPWAAEASATECASCHMQFVPKTDMTWVQFYPLLRDTRK